MKKSWLTSWMRRRTLRGELMVGFNRRFSPLARQAKDFFAGRNDPLSIVYRINAGRIPKEHWVQDRARVAGRIIGEVCHFVDFMEFSDGSVAGVGLCGIG